MRWAIRTRHLDGAPAILPGRHDSRDEAAARLARLRSAHPERAYRVVRLVTRSERLQRELAEAQRMLADARAAVGAAWLLEGSLADGIRAKTDMLEKAIFDERRRVAAQVERAAAEERQRIVEALFRCSREDLPPEVCALARERGLSLDGFDALYRRIAIREYASILATWVHRGCP